MEALPQPDTYAILPDEIHQELWDRIAARLERGDSLISTSDYLVALTTEYRAITGEDVSPALRDLFHDAVSVFNRDYPERYLAVGVQNSVARAFQSSCYKLAWDVIQIESEGVRSVARFKDRDWVREFLEEFGISHGMISEDACVRHALDVVTGKTLPLPLVDIAEPVAPALAAPLAATPEPEPAPSEPEPLADEDLSEDAIEAIGDGTISQDEVEARQAEQEETRSRIASRELERAGDRVDSYVQQGLLTSEEGQTVWRLSEIDGQVERGEIDSDEASRLRNSVLSGPQRTELERKLQGAVDPAVRFLQAFESLRKISSDLDDGLRLLIRHKDILDPDKADAERGRAAQELLEDRDLLHKVVDIMDRKDPEIRMVSVGLPPYSYVAKPNERIGNLIIEEDFVDDLRQLTADEMSDRLHSEDAEVRIRPAADIRCLIAIVNNLIKPTPFRKEVRHLRLQDAIEEFFHTTDDLEEARRQAESFVHQRLRRMFRNLSPDEKSEMEERGTGMIDAAEQRAVEQRQAVAEAAAGQGAEGFEDDDNLTDAEVEKGAILGRVGMRIAGQMRRMPRKIMRDPDDPDVYVLAQRDAETGALKPVLRGDTRRVVEQDSRGSWRLARG